MSADLPSVLEPPEHPRRLRVYRFQIIGLAVIAAIPVLALLGVFGRTTETATDSGATLSLSVEYPDRFRYKQLAAIEIVVGNLTANPIDTLVVAVDHEYAGAFSLLSFIPVAARPFEVELVGLQPGAAQHVWAEIQAEHYGRHSGQIRAYVKGSRDTTAVAVSTFVFP